jgi:hypothetical protein
MRPYTTPALGSVAISSPVKIDYEQLDFNIGLSINVVSGTNTSSVQFSLDDPDAVYATDYNTDATWHNITALAAKTADTAASLTVPCRAVRLNMTAWTSGTASLTIVQAHR